MMAIVTVLLAFVLGCTVSSWFAANVVYALAHLWAFIFQALYLLPDSLGDGDAATFEAGVFPLSYGLATLAVLGVGLGLVAAGRWTAGRRDIRRTRTARGTPTAGVGCSVP